MTKALPRIVRGRAYCYNNGFAPPQEKTMYKLWVNDVTTEPIYGPGTHKATGFMTETDFVEEGGMVMGELEMASFVTSYLTNNLYEAKEIRIVKVDKIEAPAFPSYRLSKELGLTKTVVNDEVIWQAK